MNPISTIRASRLRRFVSSLALPLAAWLAGCASNSPDYSNQIVFDHPEDAAKRLAVAVTSGNSSDVEAIFGSDSRQIMSSGDPVADRWNRQIVSVAMNERWALEPTDSTTRELVIGSEAWPFPVPLVKDARGWWFDTAAGKEEILALRIGRNELATIGTLRMYVAAQCEYAAAGRDGKPAGTYAQQIRSDPGRHDGLLWHASGPKEPHSSFGEFVAAATTEGYGTQSREGEAPYHGYYFRVLKSQGAAGPGGALDYLVNGEMTRGLAMIACPAQCGNSGVMTFIVRADGIVYQSDLGEETPAAAKNIVAYDLDDTWRVAR